MKTMLHQVIAVTGLQRCRAALGPNDVVVCAGSDVATKAAAMEWPSDCQVCFLDEQLPVVPSTWPTMITLEQWVQLAVDCELNMVWT